VWSLAKRNIANTSPKNVDELMEDILRSIERIKVSPKKLRGCILQSDLPSFLCYRLFGQMSLMGPKLDEVSHESFGHEQVKAHVAS
jgi:hypothetical protein